MESDFRKWFRRQIGKRGENVVQFALRSRIPRPTINDWLKYQAPNMRPANINLLAEALETTYEQVEEVLVQCQASAKNVVTGSHRMLPSKLIPRFDRNLAAGFWTEAIGVDESQGGGSMDLFQVRLSGDSMSPDYPDGGLVEFRVIRVADDGLEIGGNFYIQRDDDMATFKQVASMDDDMVELVAINRSKYPKPMTVERSRIVRAARAGRP